MDDEQSECVDRVHALWQELLETVSGMFGLDSNIPPDSEPVILWQREGEYYEPVIVWLPRKGT